MRSWRSVVLVATVVIASVAIAPMASAQTGSLTTGYKWESGWCAGIFIDLTPTTTLTVTSFDVYFRGTLNRNVTVYYKSGTYSGFESTPGAWTSLGTVNVTPLGDGNATPVNLGGITIPAGETYAFYFWDNLGTGGEDGGGLILGDPTTYSNANLQLRTTSYNCESAFQSPTVDTFGWEGTVYYEIGDLAVPALETAGLIGLATLVLLLGWAFLRWRSAA